MGGRNDEWGGEAPMAEGPTLGPDSFALGLGPEIHVIARDENIAL